MRFVDIIRKKRDGQALSQAEVHAVVSGVTDGSVPDYQLAAWLMAVVWRGMTVEERTALTLAMVRSGRSLELSHLPGGKVDKHSTGGIGDKISICLAPAVAACGVWVPMISGRGLGHTGGTLDKLEAIPGFRTRLESPELVSTLEHCGLVLGGQSSDVAPADRRIYALRDATGTVESLALITSSILSKKLSEGIDGLVLDVKVGNGAFMKTIEDARALADALVSTANGCGVRTVAYLTDMGQPLGRAIGNANETAEAIAVLHGAGPDDVVALTVALGAEMCVLGGVASSAAEGERMLRAALRDGRGLDRFRRVIVAQGGDPRVCDEPDRLPSARLTAPVVAARDGVVTDLDAMALGLAVIALGGGRNRAEDTVDPSVGLDVPIKRGDRVVRGQVLATVYANDAALLQDAVARVSAAVTLGDVAPTPTPLILEVRR